MFLAGTLAKTYAVDSQQFTQEDWDAVRPVVGKHKWRRLSVQRRDGLSGYARKATSSGQLLGRSWTARTSGGVLGFVIPASHSLTLGAHDTRAP